MKRLFLILPCMLVLCCNPREALQTVRKINAGLTETFHHKDINTSITLGPAPVLTITFYNFQMDDKSYQTLSDLAVTVRRKVLEIAPGVADLNNIEVKFTESPDIEEMTDFLVFNHKGEDY